MESRRALTVALSCWILFCHLSLDIIEAVSAEKQQKVGKSVSALIWNWCVWKQGVGCSYLRCGCTPNCPFSLLCLNQGREEAVPFLTAKQDFPQCCICQLE